MLGFVITSYSIHYTKVYEVWRIPETVRASVQSLFDAYASGESIGTIGAFGSSYFDALLNVPIFVKTHPEGRNNFV